MKTNKIYFHLLTLLLLNGCQTLPGSSFHSLLQSQPYLVALSPDPKDELEKIEKIELTFSTPIEPTSINEKAILLIQEDMDPKQPPSLDLIEKNLSGGKFSPVAGNIAIEEDPHKVIWSPSTPLQNEHYTLFITPKLEGIGKIPFNQKPGEKATALIAVFKLKKKSSDSSSPPSSEPPPNPNPKIRPTTLMINEILYDATDNDTDGNEFIELHGTPNTEIDGYQLILINGGDGKVLKIITLPENSKIQGNEIFLIADAKTGKPSQSNIPGADFIDNFDPQNGPDAIQLLDDQGHLIDSVAYGSGVIPVATNGFLTGEGGSALDVQEGHSLSRKNGIDTNNNQTDFRELEIPTPGIL